MGEKAEKMKATNFDTYLKQQLKDSQFAERFQNAGEAWDVALKLAALRKQAGLSQQELARRLNTTQQQISRLESPSYEGHSLSMLRRVAAELGAEIEITFRPARTRGQQTVAEPRAKYKRLVKKSG